MSNSSGESSSSEPSGFRRVAVSIPAILTILLLGFAISRPLAAKLTRRFAPNRQAGAAAVPQTNAAQGITGQIVDSVTGAPISGGEVIVALEQPDGTGTDVIFTQVNADTSGGFSFKLLPLGSTFDAVAVATDGTGVAYGATVVLNVPVGASLGAIPLVHESGAATGPAKISGYVTASSGSGPSVIRATVSAIQTISIDSGLDLPVEVPQTVTISGGNTRPITIPGGPGTSADIAVRSNSGCPASASGNVNCGEYAMTVPGSNPSIAVFASGKISYAPPAAGPAFYSVRANAFRPSGNGSGVCIPSFQTANSDDAGNPLKLLPGGTATARPIAFTSCW
jgi:hypothetical protein